MTQKRKKSGTGLWLLLIVILLGIVGYFAGYKIWGPNTGNMQNGEYLYIPTGADYAFVLQELREGGYIDDHVSFDLLAKRAKYPQSVKAGKFKVPAGISNYDLIRKLRSGKQEPVKIVIVKLRTKQQLLEVIEENLEADSTEIAELLNNNSVLSTYGFDTSSAIAAVIPDTYEFFWNTSAEKAYERFVYYYNRFWTEERKQKAISKSLTPLQVMILASIVEEETNKVSEKPTVASVYLNRLKYNMKLDADPTVKFAVQDFGLRRILNKHLKFDSPYNTYMYPGLPPGPIATPSKSSINAVLNAAETDYLYFCAKEDFSGFHNFARSYSEHIRNARRYQKALNERGIK